MCLLLLINNMDIDFVEDTENLYISASYVDHQLKLRG